MTDVSENIKNARNAKRYTQKELADLLKVKLVIPNIRKYTKLRTAPLK